MPFVVVPNTVEVELRMILEGQRIENTLYYRSESLPAAPAMQALALDHIGWWSTQAAPLLPIDVSLVEVVVTSLASATDPRVTEVPVDPVNGTLGSPALPNNVSLAVSFRTANRGRSFAGRNYIAALTEGQVVNSQVNSGTVAAWRDAYAAILTTITGDPSPWTCVVVSRFSGVDSNGKPVPRVTGLSTPITTVVVTDSTVDSMRRRLPGRGR